MASTWSPLPLRPLAHPTACVRFTPHFGLITCSSNVLGVDEASPGEVSVVLGPLPWGPCAAVRPQRVRSTCTPGARVFCCLCVSQRCPLRADPTREGFAGLFPPHAGNTQSPAAVGRLQSFSGCPGLHLRAGGGDWPLNRLITEQPPGRPALLLREHQVFQAWDRGLWAVCVQDMKAPPAPSWLQLACMGRRTAAWHRPAAQLQAQRRWLSVPPLPSPGGRRCLCLRARGPFGSPRFSAGSGPGLSAKSWSACLNW